MRRKLTIAKQWTPQKIRVHPWLKLVLGHFQEKETPGTRADGVGDRKFTGAVETSVGKHRPVGSRQEQIGRGQEVIGAA